MICSQDSLVKHVREQIAGEAVSSSRAKSFDPAVTPAVTSTRAATSPVDQPSRQPRSPVPSSPPTVVSPAIAWEIPSGGPFGDLAGPQLQPRVAGSKTDKQEGITEAELLEKVV